MGANPLYENGLLQSGDILGCVMMFDKEELFILSSGLLQLINNVSQAKRLVYEEETQNALDKELKMYQELNTKLMQMCK